MVYFVNSELSLASSGNRYIFMLLRIEFISRDDNNQQNNEAISQKEQQHSRMKFFKTQIEFLEVLTQIIKNSFRAGRSSQFSQQADNSSSPLPSPIKSLPNNIPLQKNPKIIPKNSIIKTQNHNFILSSTISAPAVIPEPTRILSLFLFQYGSTFSTFFSTTSLMLSTFSFRSLFSYSFLIVDAASSILDSARFTQYAAVSLALFQSCFRSLDIFKCSYGINYIMDGYVFYLYSSDNQYYLSAFSSFLVKLPHIIAHLPKQTLHS